MISAWPIGSPMSRDNVLHASIADVELVSSILEVHHLLNDLFDEIEAGSFPALLIGELAEEIRRRLDCPDAPRATCKLVDAALQAMIEQGDLTVPDDDGRPIIAHAEVTR